MTLKEILIAFIDQALLFKTSDPATIFLGIMGWFGIAVVVGGFYLMAMMI